MMLGTNLKNDRNWNYTKSFKVLVFKVSVPVLEVCTISFNQVVDTIHLGDADR